MNLSMTGSVVNWLSRIYEWAQKVVETGVPT